MENDELSTTESNEEPVSIEELSDKKEELSFRTLLDKFFSSNSKGGPTEPRNVPTVLF